MATPVISNTYVGDGSTVLYSFTFPYIEISDVQVTLDAVETTEYIFANATTIQFNTAPAVDVDIVIYRVTDNSALKAVFFPGSAIRARDLNDDFTQSLYVVQEATLNVDDANANSQAALEAATTAESQSTEALSTANTALSQSSTALTGVSDAQQAAAEAASDASQAQADAATAQAAASNAETAAQEVADAIDAGPVLSVNGENGVVIVGVEQLADFAYYPASEEFTFLGPCVETNAELEGTAYQTNIVGNELFFAFPKTNTNAYEVLSDLPDGAACVLCIYTAGGYVELNATAQQPPGNNGGTVPSWSIQFEGEIAESLLGDYPFKIKSAFITNGQAPITTGQALIYDQTTESWRPEDVSLDIGSLPTLP